MKITSLLPSLLLALALHAAETPPPAPAPAVAEAKTAHELGLSLQKERKIPEAIAAFEKATTLDATKAEYFSALGIAISERMRELPFMEQGQYAGQFRKALAKSVELDPNHLPGLIGLARYYANAPEIAGGSLNKAKDYAQRVHALQPFLGSLELGTVAERGEDFAEALKHYDAASQLQPRNAAPHVFAGRMLAKLGRKDEARARLETALQIDPQREAAKKALADLTAASTP